MGGAMLIKSLTRFSVDGRGCVPFLLVWPEAVQYWSPQAVLWANGGLLEGSCQLVLSRTAAASVSVPTVSHSYPLSLQETLQYSQVGLAHSLMWSLPFPLRS